LQIRLIGNRGLDAHCDKILQHLLWGARFERVAPQVFLFLRHDNNLEGEERLANVGPIEIVIEKNKNFRQVLFTGKHFQLVVMSLKAKEEIGNEVHKNVDEGAEHH
jgi:hypothetical protein